MFKLKDVIFSMTGCCCVKKQKILPLGTYTYLEGGSREGKRGPSKVCTFSFNNTEIVGSSLFRGELLCCQIMMWFKENKEIIDL